MRRDKDISELLAKAKESMNAAKSLYENKFYDFSVGRSYYAMFYVTEAVLLTKNLSFSKHSAVIGAFGKDFIKTKILPLKLREYLTYAFDLRQIGDYGSTGSINKGKAKELIEQSREFIEAIEGYLKKEKYKI